MADALREQVVSWLYEDFWEIHRNDQRASELVLHILDLHGRSFRVRAKRLCREAMGGGSRARVLLVEFLAQELMGGQRLAGKTGAGRVRLRPMVENESLAVLMEDSPSGRGGARWIPCTSEASTSERRTCVDEARKRLSDLLVDLDNNPARVDSMPVERLLALADQMLLSDTPDGVLAAWTARANAVETCLELREDLLRGEVALGGMDSMRARGFVESADFAQLVKKQAGRGRTVEDLRKAFLDVVANSSAANVVIEDMAVEEAKASLADLGRPAPRADGTLPDPIPPRKQGLDLGLVERYLRSQGGYSADSDALCDDLEQLYLSTRGEERYSYLSVPASIDPLTGIGLHLLGREKLARRSLRPLLPGSNVTVVAVDDRSYEPRTLIGGNELRGVNQQAIDSMVGMIRRGVENLHPVRYDAKLSFLEDYLPPRHALREVSTALGELYYDYQEMRRIGLRACAASQKVDAPPEDCPERFLRYFESSESEA